MNIQTRLYEKAAAEHSAFLSKIQMLPGHQAIEHAYEKVIKDDLLICLESCEMPDKEAKALFRLKEPLDEMYREWLDNDFSHMDMLRETISDLAKKEIRLRERDLAR